MYVSQHFTAGRMSQTDVLAKLRVAESYNNWSLNNFLNSQVGLSSSS